MSTPLIDKSFEGLLKGLRRDITELQRRLFKDATGGTTLPEIWQGFGPDTGTITAPAATWGDIDPALTVTYTPAAALRVLVYSTAVIVGNDTVYGMVGVKASGGVVLEPDYDQATGIRRFALTAYSANAAATSITSIKKLILPAGVATTLTMQQRRNTAAFAPAFNYPAMMVVPQGWA